MTAVPPVIELIFSADCPNVDLARERLRAAFSLVDRQPEWLEWERTDPDAPPHAALYGSPTVLVNGTDVSGSEATASADSCRVYPAGPGGFSRAPEVESIVAALRSAEVK